MSIINCVICDKEIEFGYQSAPWQPERDIFGCCSGMYSFITNSTSKEIVSEYIYSSRYNIAYYYSNKHLDIYDKRKNIYIFSQKIEIDRIPNLSTIEAIRNFLLMP